MKKTFITQAMIMIWLIITLPIVGAQGIGAGNFVRASIPEFVKASIIDVIGTTQPNSIVNLYLDGELIDTRTADEDGSFVFRALELIQTTSTIKLESDYQGNIAEESYETTVDDMPPTIQVTIEDVVTSPNVNADITVSEAVNLTITKTRAGKKPDKITGLKELDATETEINIEWDEQDDILEYLVYRNGKRIAKITKNYYDDATVGADKNYVYKITAVNNECVESDISDPLTITTPIGEAQERDLPDNIFASCYTPAMVKFLQKGTSKVQIALSHNQNILNFEVSDRAGLTAKTQKTVFYDTGPPIFIETNLEDMTVSYKRYITITGKISEAAAVTVYVNDKAITTKPTNEDGSF